RTAAIMTGTAITMAKKKASRMRSPERLPQNVSPASSMTGRTHTSLRLAWTMDPLPARHQSHDEENRPQHQVKDMVAGVQQHGAEVPRPIQRRVADRQPKRCKREIERSRCYAEALCRRLTQEAAAECQSTPQQVHQVVIFVHVRMGHDCQDTHYRKEPAKE